MKKMFMLMAVATVLLFASCREFQEQKYVEVGTNQTAYVIPLEQGSLKSQTKLNG